MDFSHTQRKEKTSVFIESQDSKRAFVAHIFDEEHRIRIFSEPGEHVLSVCRQFPDKIGLRGDQIEVEDIITQRTLSFAAGVDDIFAKGGT